MEWLHTTTILTGKMMPCQTGSIYPSRLAQARHVGVAFLVRIHSTELQDTIHYLVQY